MTAMRLSSAVSFSTSALTLSHPYSGNAVFEIDGRIVKEVDLYQRDWSTISSFSVANDLARPPHTLRSSHRAGAMEKALGAQLLLHEIVCTRASDADLEEVPAAEQIGCFQFVRQPST